MIKEKLSKQQRKICAHLLLGKRNIDIAREMKIHTGTVKFHIGNIFKIVGAKSRSELIVKLIPIVFPDKPLKVSLPINEKNQDFEYIHALLRN